MIPRRRRTVGGVLGVHQRVRPLLGAHLRSARRAAQVDEVQHLRAAERVGALLRAQHRVHQLRDAPRHRLARGLPARTAPACCRAWRALCSTAVPSATAPLRGLAAFSLQAVCVRTAGPPHPLRQPWRTVHPGTSGAGSRSPALGRLQSGAPPYVHLKVPCAGMIMALEPQGALKQAEVLYMYRAVQRSTCRMGTQQQSGPWRAAAHHSRRWSLETRQPYR